MAFSVTVSMSAVSGAISVIGSTAYTGGGRVGLDTTIADSITDQLHTLAIDVSQIQAIVFNSDQDVTLEVNNSTTGTPTIAVKANVPYVWNTDQYFTNLLNVDVTAFYFTNASGSLATIKMECVYDDTP